MASNNSAKGILYLGGLAFVLLLGIAWWFAAATSDTASERAREYAEATRAESALANLGQAAEDVADSAVESVETAVSDATEAAEESVENAVETATAIADDASDAVAQIASDGSDAPTDAAETAAAATEAVVADVEETAAEITGSASDAVEQATADAETAAEETVVAVEETASAAATAAVGAAATTVAAVSGDAGQGEKVFRKCKACHRVGDGAKNGVGPMLNGIVGSPVGSVEGFKYSNIFQEAASSGDVWTPENLAAFLEKPKEHYPGTKMSFAGLRKESDRENVIAYLATQE